MIPVSAFTEVGAKVLARTMKNKYGAEIVKPIKYDSKTELWKFSYKIKRD